MLLLALSAAAARAEAPQARPPEPGLEPGPPLAYQSGDHRFELGLAQRVRAEVWDAFAPGSDWFVGSRTRVRAHYAWRELAALSAEYQHVELAGMGADASGAALAYRNANGGDARGDGDQLRQLWLELRPHAALSLRGGRQDLEFGSEPDYPEPDWRYLKSARLGQRLVGTVGWSHVERAYDGASARLDLAGTRFTAFGAQPTTGVFDAERGYRRLDGILIGGLGATVARGALSPDAELGFFAIAYQDERSSARGGLLQDVEVYTLGASWLGVHALGPGKLDLLLWGAGQLGDYDGQDHAAGAGLFEVGYQLPRVFARPWLRAGVNAASGDGSPADGRHRTFFNLMPTNHPYYGFADQLAFQNLVDSFVQLKLAPHPRLALNLFFHDFRLHQSEDARYAGSGAFDHDSFGFSALAANGNPHVGQEYDLVLGFTPHEFVELEVGYAYLDGGGAFAASASRTLHFGYAMLSLRY